MTKMVWRLIKEAQREKERRIERQVKKLAFDVGDELKQKDIFTLDRGIRSGNYL